jgi:hypothetical protein
VNAVFKTKLTLDPCGWQHEQDLIISSKPNMSAFITCQRNRTLKNPKTLGNNKIYGPWLHKSLPVSVSCLIVGGKENIEQERFVLFCAKCMGKNASLTPKKTPKKVFQFESLLKDLQN